MCMNCEVSRLTRREQEHREDLAAADARIAELAEELAAAGDFHRAMAGFLDDLEESVDATREALVLTRKEWITD